jgi:hypothetical protein|tara:strand:+ start:5147 stop:5458 length:312 start_codon:yes stop_codon:yes gene_type:complete
MSPEMPALAAVIAVTMGLIKVIEMLINKNSSKGSILTGEERGWLQGLHDLHEKCDTDGTPLVYVPRSWAEIQRNMQHVMTKIVNDQRRIADILERIDKKLDDK